jgi:hypothetical protein
VMTQNFFPDISLSTLPQWLAGRPPQHNRRTFLTPSMLRGGH